MARYLEDLKEKYCHELMNMAQKDVSAENLEMVAVLLDCVKDIYKIQSMKGEEGYSVQNGMNYSNGSYDGGYSRRGWPDRMMYDDRYSNNSYMTRNTGRGYSRDDGKEMMIDELEKIAYRATSEEMRQAIDKCIKQIENA